MIPKYIIIWFLFSLGPDMDFAFKLPHRNWFFHSIILPVIFTSFFWGIRGTSFCLVPWSCHLLCDMYQEPGKKRIGTYCIHFVDDDKLNGKQTDIWLTVNAIIGLMLGWLFDFIPLVM